MIERLSRGWPSRSWTALLSPVLKVVMPALLLLAGLGTAPAAAERLGAPEPGQLGLQVGPSPISHRLNEFHDLLLIIISLITLVVLALLAFVVWRYRAAANPTPARFTHSTLVEVIWTAVPVLILIVIAIPSFRLMYYLDAIPEEVVRRTGKEPITLKITGNQWNWTYTYPDHGNVQFTANMLTDAKQFADPNIRTTLLESETTRFTRLLSTDRVVVLPKNTPVQLLITGSDVIHAWALPSLGVKKDAMPGRVNEAWLLATETGTFYGQCSEICGINHGFMPIEVRVVEEVEFLAWIEKAKEAGWVGEDEILADASAPAAVTH